jgi:hypothetical protein
MPDAKLDCGRIAQTGLAPTIPFAHHGHRGRADVQLRGPVARFQDPQETRLRMDERFEAKLEHVADPGRIKCWREPALGGGNPSRRGPRPARPGPVRSARTPRGRLAPPSGRPASVTACRRGSGIETHLRRTAARSWRARCNWHPWPTGLWRRPQRRTRISGRSIASVRVAGCAGSGRHRPEWRIHPCAHARRPDPPSPVRTGPPSPATSGC